VLCMHAISLVKRVKRARRTPADRPGWRMRGSRETRLLPGPLGAFRRPLRRARASRRQPACCAPLRGSRRRHGARGLGAFRCRHF
jgi:hypothetical protein